MATTRIISMHINKGKTIAQCLKDRIDYAKNPEKTDDGKFISSYQCNPQIVDAEFLFAKRQYKAATGRTQDNDVIAYQIRQSFKPGEITPEEANQIGYELAKRFTKGEHAFIVTTHVDRHHIHNHIIWNSTSLDCSRKFRNFWRSGRAVARLSDTICIEHGKSIVENPQRSGMSYNKWLGNQAKPSQRDLLRSVLDGALKKQPTQLDELLASLKDAGYEVKRGKNISVRAQGAKRFVRLSSLGDGYGEDELRAVISGAKKHTPRKNLYQPTQKKPSLLIDIDAKLREGKGGGYQRWASKFNAKQLAETLNYLKEHQVADMNELRERKEKASADYHELSDRIKSAEARMAEIAVLKTQIINYAKTRDVFSEYKKSGYSSKYLAAHETDIILHRAAKKAFNERGLKKLPSVKSLQTEYAALLAEKKDAYADYRRSRDEMRELLTVQSNLDRILGEDTQSVEKKKEQER